MMNSYKIYVGTYTQPILFGTGEILEGKGKGIYRYTMNAGSGEMLLESEPAAITVNPSFLDLDEEKKVLYAVNELKEFEGKKQGAVSTFRMRENGKLDFIQQLPTGGQDPCHVRITNDGQSVTVANFYTGSIAAFRRDTEGSLRQTDFVQHQGKSADSKRQQGPHAHSFTEDREGKYLLVPDLGTDTVYFYQLDETGRLKPEEKMNYHCIPGEGPRYGAFHPNGKWFYLIHELASSIAVFDYGISGLERKQSVDTVPTDRKKINTCAHIAVSSDGRTLYASNRGDDSICVFHIDQKNGKLQQIQKISSGGKTPRHFALTPDNRFLLAANQDSDNITVFFAVEDGMLSECQKIWAPTPVCICISGK